MTVTLLFANGEVSRREIALIRSMAFDRVAAADGGLLAALNHGFRPDAVIGDFDSVPAEIKGSLSAVHWVHRPSQEQCDLEKALAWLKETGSTAVTVLGFAGKRLDHTLSNLSVLARWDRELDLTLLTPDAEVFIVRDRVELIGNPGRLVSLVPFCSADQVVTTGLRYPLNKEPLAFGKREGVSNEMTGESATITIGGGLLFVFLHLEPAE